MGLKDIWAKTSFARKAEEEKTKKDEDEALREKVRREIQPELERIKMDKIKEEELAKARGTFVEPEKKKNPLAMLGEEFKQSNIGSNDQMSKILGNQGNSGKNVDVNSEFKGKGSMLGDTERLLNTVTSDKRVNTNQNYGNMMGRDNLSDSSKFGGMLNGGKEVRKDYGNMMGMKRPEEEKSKVGGFAARSKEEQIERMLGKKK
jgi:hypothetical protein